MELEKQLQKSCPKMECIVVLASRSVDKLKNLQNEINGKSLVVEMDVSESDSVSEALKKVEQEFGQIDILVNSAGTMPLTYMKNRHLDEWLQTIEVNVKGVLRCIDAVLPTLKKQNGGHIVNITSIDGKEFYKGGAVYSASKAAVIALSRAMLQELSQSFNIRVTSLEPGTVDTNLRDDISDQEFVDDQDWNEKEVKLQSEDIANGVLYAVTQPNHVNVNELLITPTGS